MVSRSKTAQTARAGIVCARAKLDAGAQVRARGLRWWLTRPFVVLLRAYQLGVSPLLGTNCRFVPSCSQYGIEAFETYGVLRGGWLTIRRVLRCRPGGGSGYDPVPEQASLQDVTE